MPIYQIAAPPQMWNLFGLTTDELVGAREGRVRGYVLVGGSHIDSMLGSNCSSTWSLNWSPKLAVG